MYIFVNRMGGLGNQLFQYAAARAVAELNTNSQILIQHEKYNPHNENNQNYADIFMKDAIQVAEITDKTRNYFIFEQGGSFIPWNPLHIAVPVKLSGYFQYLPAIEKVLPSLIKDFLSSLEKYRKCFTVDPDNSVFVHIRRGDYLNLPDYHYSQQKEYYDKVFIYWKEKYGRDDFTIYMVSDDIEWCRQQQWSFPCVFYDHKDELYVLALMSLCKAGAIMANSTFSYWGAMLSGTDNVFYPDRWIGEKIHNLFPSEWRCMPSI